MSTDQPSLFDGLDERESRDAPPAAPPAVTAGHDGPLRRLIDANFLQYASYVIRDRAIPDARDGLKPVQRRILHSLFENDDGKFIKVANIVGHAMQYHPHGDASIGDALVALTNKGFLIEGQGNFGNVLTGDPAAAARYIECRLTELARRELFNPELTEFVPSYDGRRKEPVTLPAKLPLLLMQGAEGIAVGLSTKVLPHNFKELLEAQIAILGKKPFTLYPDFRQGGLMDVQEYASGNGRIRVRAVVEPRGEHALVIREIPFGTTTDALIASIETAARKQQVKVKSIDDYTAEKIEIEITLTPDQDREKAIQALYAFTACEVSLSGRIVVIEENRPVELDVAALLKRDTARLRDILERELRCEKKRLTEDIHHKTLVQLFVEHRIYKDIESCDTYAKVKKAVLDGVNRFRDQLRRDVTQDDVEMLLGIAIKRISLFDIEKNREQIVDLVQQLAEVEKQLGDLTAHAIRYLKDLLKTYGPTHPRATRITKFEEVAVRELTAQELILRHDRANGYLGHAITGEDCVTCSSLDKIILCWADGRYKVIPPPDKLFVDQDIIYCAIVDRDRVMTTVYTHGQITYLKRFTFGGTIQNKEYQFAQPDAQVLFFSDASPDELFVKYKPSKNQRIHQQVFTPADTSVKGAKARGVQMTVKAIARITTEKPRGWDENAGPKGALMSH